MSVAIVGIGIHPFGNGQGRTALEQASIAAHEALNDAGISWDEIGVAVGGSAQGGWPDSLVNDLGLTGVSFTNVINGCATGGQALATAVAAIDSGRAELGLVVGFDKHPRGAFQIDPTEWGIGEWYGQTGMALTTQFFAMKINRYLHDHALSEDLLSIVAEKAFRNGAMNPNAWRRTPFNRDEIAASAMLSDPLRKYMFCSPSEGAVALILADARIAARFTRTPVRIGAICSVTRRYGSFEVFSPSIPARIVGGPSEDAARKAFDLAGIGPGEIDLAQIQDTESGAEIIHLAEAGLCAHGEQEKMIRDGVTEISGRLPINTDGGCIANGEPVGASGLRQIFENVLQLRGQAGKRQVSGDPKTALTHVYGMPGLSAVTILHR